MITNLLRDILEGLKHLVSKDIDRPIKGGLTRNIRKINVIKKVGQVN